MSLFNQARQGYSNARQTFRESTPLWARKAARPLFGTALAAEDLIDKALPGSYYDTEKQATTTTPYGPDETNNAWDPNSSSYNKNQGNKFATTRGTTPYANSNSAINNAAVQEFANSSAQIDKAYNLGLISWEDKQAALEENRQSILNQVKDLTKNFNRQIKNLGVSRDSTLESQNMAFNAMSPNAYQSQQGTYANKVQQNYDESVADATSQFKTQKDIANKALNKVGQNMAFLGAMRTVEGSSPEGFNVSSVQARLTPIETSKYYNKFNDLSIGNMIKGGNVSPDKLYLSLRNKIEGDQSMTDEEKQKEMSFLDSWLLGGYEPSTGYANTI